MRTGSDWHNKQSTTSSLDGGELEPPRSASPEALCIQIKTTPENCKRSHGIICRSFRQKGLQEVVAVTFALAGLGGGGEIVWLPVMSKATLKALVIEVFVFLHSGKGKFRNSVPTLKCCWLDASQTCAPTWARWWSFPTTDRHPSLTTRYADIKHQASNECESIMANHLSLNPHLLISKLGNPLVVTDAST